MQVKQTIFDFLRVYQHLQPHTKKSSFDIAVTDQNKRLIAKFNAIAWQTGKTIPFL